MLTFTVHLTVEMSQSCYTDFSIILWDTCMVHSFPIIMVLLCTLHVCCSHGDEKNFVSAYTAWCQVYNSRLTFLYLLYILGIFRLFMHIEAGQKSQTSRFLSVLVLVVMKQIGSKCIIFTNLWKCYFTM